MRRRSSRRLAHAPSLPPVGLQLPPEGIEPDAQQFRGVRLVPTRSFVDLNDVLLLQLRHGQDRSVLPGRSGGLRPPRPGQIRREVRGGDGSSLRQVQGGLDDGPKLPDVAMEKRLLRPAARLVDRPRQEFLPGPALARHVDIQEHHIHRMYGCSAMQDTRYASVDSPPGARVREDAAGSPPQSRTGGLLALNQVHPRSHRSCRNRKEHIVA